MAMALISDSNSSTKTGSNGGNTAPTQDQLNAQLAAAAAAKQAKTDAIKNLASQAGTSASGTTTTTTPVTTSGNTSGTVKSGNGIDLINQLKSAMGGTTESAAEKFDNSTAGKLLSEFKDVVGSNAASTSDTSATTTTTYTPTTTTVTDYYSQLLDLFQTQNEAARQNQLNAIMKNLESVKSSYQNQIQNVIDEYDALVDANEVAKYKARKSLRENQANRGQLDSGMGRQEALEMNLNYDNNANSIKTAKQNAINEIYNLITQAEAEAESNKATVNNTYANALLQYQLAQQ